MYMDSREAISRIGFKRSREYVGVPGDHGTNLVEC